MNLCENCEERPGETNSHFVDVGEDGLGAWVCVQCEEILERDYWAAIERGEIMRADMSDVGKKSAQAGADQGRQGDELKND